MINSLDSMVNKPWLSQLLALLILICLFLVGIPFFAQRVELGLQQTIQQDLQAHQMDWAKVQLNGRDVILSGEANTVEQSEAVVAQVQQLSGVHHIDNTIQVKIKKIAPYTFQADYQNKQLRLSGYLPDDSYQQQIVAQTRRMFANSQLKDEIQLARGEPAQWRKILPTILVQLQQFERANLEISDYDIRLTGTVNTTKQAETIKTSMQALRAYNYHPHLYLDANDETALICQKKFNGILAMERIRFQSNKASIQSSSYALLERLFNTAETCPQYNITIAGHSDAQGDAQSNKILSQKRAEAVSRYLVGLGLKPSRLNAVGYGESQPVADNETEAGKTANRRIEFVIESH